MGHVNGLFLDWSVKKIGLKELWVLEWHREFDAGHPLGWVGQGPPEDWPEWMRGFGDY